MNTFLHLHHRKGLEIARAPVRIRLFYVDLYAKTPPVHVSVYPSNKVGFFFLRA